MIKWSLKCSFSQYVTDTRPREHGYEDNSKPLLEKPLQTKFDSYKRNKEK